MHFVEVKICEKIGNVLAECNNVYQDSLQLLRIWLNSETFERVIDGDVALCSQAKSYIIREFTDENKSQLESIQSGKVLSNDTLFWMGYLITYWCIEYLENPKNILKIYDIENIMYSYDVLHSLSIKSTIEKIKEDYHGSNCAVKEPPLSCGIDSTLPDFLKKSIAAFLIGKEKYESGTGYSEFDMDYCDLQTDINVCEVEQMITSDEAWILRERYLGLQKV